MEIPNTASWPEMINKRARAMAQKGETLGIERLFFHYDLKNPDPRFHALMIRCVVLYLFGDKESAKSWLVYKDENGVIKNTIYSAILVNKDEWVIGKPEMIWEAQADRDEDGNLLGIILSLDTENGIKKAYFVKPTDWQK